MANEIQLPVKLYIENLQNIVKDMRGQLGNLKVDSAGYKRLLNVINDIEKRIQSVQVQSSRPFFDMKQFNDVEKEIGRIQDDFTKIGIEAGKVKFSDLQLDASQRAKLQEFDAAIKASNEELKNLKETAKEAFLSSDVGQLWKENHKDAAARSFEQITKVIVNEVEEQKQALKEAENAYNDYKNLISTNKKLGAFLGKNQNHELSEANMGKEMYDRIFGTRGDKTVFKSGGRDLLTDWLVKNFSLDRSVVEKLVADSADKVQKAFAEVHGKVEQALQQEKVRIGSAAKEARTSSNNGKSYTEAITEKQATLNAAEAANNGLVATNQAVKKTEEELIDSIERNKAAREEYKQEILRQAQAYLEMRGPAEQASGSLQKLTQVAEQGKARLASLDKATGKLQGISNFINRYVGAYAIIRKVTQAIRNAFSNIKELDKVITNIAVVTNMSQQDLWGKIGEYTDMAQQYGVATKDVYTVSQLFYQQGLQTNQVMSLTTETLKMAKIAGMDYAEATNAMTVAIRAFNIDMQQAQQVTDTYSALAAKFAVSSAEIANAMEKTASSAANVGMSLQSTSAFMSVMIQTTRESAQNIGSALKSIISRYGEMKASPASLINVDGEEVAFNKVDTALKSIGISIKDASGQFRDFDDVIMELAGKWNTLDNNTQRYIATVMAGNRQQSRFIALVSNYDELNRAMQTASDSENASIVQVGKTMDSLETKAQQLKNAFSQLYLDLHIEQGLKDIYSWLTRIVQTIGKLGIAKGVLPTLANLIGFGTGAKSLINLGKEKIDSIKSQWIVKTDEAEKELKRIREEAERPMTATMNIDVSQMQHALEMKALDAQNTVISSLNGISGAVPQAQAEKILWEAQKNGTLHTDRATVIEKLGIKKEDTANYEAIDRFLQELDRATTMVQKLAGAVDEGTNAEVAKTDAVHGDEQAERQKEEQVRSSETVVEEETGSHRTLIERITDSIRSLFSHKQAVDNDASALNNHAGENSGGGSGGLLTFLTNHKTGIMKGLSVFSSLSRMVGTGIALNGASIQDKSTDLNERSKVMTGIGNGLSGAGTGISLGMMTGQPIIAALGGIVGFAVSGLKTVIDGATMTIEERLALEQQEAKKASDEALKKQAEALDVSSQLDNLKKLQKAQYNSTEDMNAYIEAMNNLGEQYPSLISSYDNAGNAIIELSNAEQELIGIRLEASSAAREAAVAELKARNTQSKILTNVSQEIEKYITKGASTTTDDNRDDQKTYIPFTFQNERGIKGTEGIQELTTIGVLQDFGSGSNRDYENQNWNPGEDFSYIFDFLTKNKNNINDESIQEIIEYYSTHNDELLARDDIVNILSYIKKRYDEIPDDGVYRPNDPRGNKDSSYGYTDINFNGAELRLESDQIKHLFGGNEQHPSFLDQIQELRESDFSFNNTTFLNDINNHLEKYKDVLQLPKAADGKTLVETVFGFDAKLTNMDIDFAKDLINKVNAKINAYNDSAKILNKQAVRAYSQEALDYSLYGSRGEINSTRANKIADASIFTSLINQGLESAAKKAKFEDAATWATSEDASVKNAFNKTKTDLSNALLLWLQDLSDKELDKFIQISEELDAYTLNEIQSDSFKKDFKITDENIQNELIDQYMQSNKANRDRILKTIYNYDGDQQLWTLNDDLTGLKGFSNYRNITDENGNTKTEEINKAMQIAYRISTSTMISKYSDYFTTQLLEINDLAEQGLTVVAEARLNALNTLSQQISQNNGEVQRELFNLVTSIDFSDYDSILNAQKELENYAKDHKNVDLKPMIDNLKDAASKILFNMNTLTQTITSKITEAAKSIDGIISTNKSGLSFDKALEEFNSLESQFDKIKTFSDAFTFDTQLGRYVYTVDGLQAAIEQKENELSKNIEQANNVKETYTALINQRSNINLKADAQSKKEFINSANVTTLSSDVNIQEAYSQLLGEFYDIYQENERTIGNWHKYLNKRVKEATDQYDAAKIIEQEYRKNEKNQWFQAIDWSALLLNVDFDGTNKVLMDELARSLNMTGATAEAIINRYFETTYSDDAARAAMREAFDKTNDEGKISKYQTALGELLSYQTGQYLSEATKQISNTLKIDVNNIEDSAENSIHAAAQFLNTLANEIGKGGYTLEQYNQDAQSVLDKTLAQKSQGKTLLDFASGDINSGALNSLAQALGQKLTDIVNVETGEFKNAIFDAYLDYDAATNTYKITSSFEEFVEALNRQYGNVIDTTSIQYIEALNSWNDSQIESQNKFKDNLLKQVESISSAKSGDMLNITYLYNLIGDDLNQIGDDLNQILLKYGAEMKEGVLTIQPGAQIQAIYSTIIDELEKTGQLSAREVGKLKDSLISLFTNITSLISSGISGSLSNEGFAQLSEWASTQGIASLDFVETADGLKLAQHSAIELYNALKDIDSLKADKVFQEISKSLQETNGYYKSISTIENRIVELRSKFKDTKDPTKKKQYEEELALAEQIKAVRSTSEDDSFNFMSNEIPAAQQNPLNYLSNWSTAWSTITESAKSGYMDYTDFYNIITEMSNIAEKSGTEIDLGAGKFLAKAEDAADLIRQGAKALSITADGSIKVDLSKIGANFMTSADGMTEGIDAGIKEIARSQIDMLNSMIQLMETIVAMEQLGDIDIEGNGIDFSDLFYWDSEKGERDFKQFSEGYEQYRDYVLKRIDEENYPELFNEDLANGINKTKLKVGDQEFIFGDLLKMEPSKLAEHAEDCLGDAYAAVLQAYKLAVMSGNYDINTIMSSIKEVLAGTGFEGEIEIGDMHLVYKYDTVLEKGKDGKYHIGDKEFPGTDDGFKKATSYQKATELKALQGIKSEQDENGIITFKHNFITNADYDVETGTYNIKFKDGSTATATSKEGASLAIATYAEMTHQDVESTGAQVTDAKPIEFTIQQEGYANLLFTVKDGKTEVKVDGQGNHENLLNAQHALEKTTNTVDTAFNEQTDLDLTIGVDESSAIEAGKSAKQIAEDAANTDPAKIHFVYDITPEEAEIRKQADKIEQQAHDVAIEAEAKNPGQIDKNDARKKAEVMRFNKQQDDAQNARYKAEQAAAKKEQFDKQAQEAQNERYKAEQAAAKKEQFDKYIQTDTQFKLASWMQEHKDELESAGETISEGIAKGMVQKPTIVQDSSKSLYNYIEQSFRMAADANSPAKNMIPWGESITDGIIVGMLSRSDSLTATAKQLFDLLQAALSGEEYTLDNIFTDKVLSLTPPSATIETNNNQEDSNSNSAISTVVNNLDDTKSAFASTTVEVESFKEAIPTENLEKLNSEFTNLKAGFSKVNSETSTVGRNIRDLGDTSSSTKTPIYELGKEADIARGHVSKFGELAGGAEHPVDELGAAAATATGQVTSLGGSSDTAAGSLNGLSGAAAAAAAALGNIQVNVSVNVSGGSPGGTSGDSNGSTSNQPNVAPDAKGTIGLANAKGTLMGELGPELVVSNGRYFVVGQTGPEMVDLAPDAIVFNHLQTKSLLEKGTSPGRGKAITNERTATAYATGSIHGGPAKADAQAALNALIQLRAEWKALLDMSVKDFTSKGTAGGGGGNSQFIKDVEKWYNWLQKIAQLEKDINYQESLRSRIASDFNADGYKYYKSQKQSLKDLTAEISTQKDLLDSQKEYFEKRRKKVNAASNPFSQFYTIDEYGQLKYTDNKFSYTDSKGKTHKYEGGYAALHAINETDVYGNKVHSTEEQMAMMKAFLGEGVVEKYRKDESGNKRDDAAVLEELWSKMEGDQSEFQGLYDSITDLEKSIEDNITKQNEILKEMEDNQISVENRVYDAIVDMRERAIEEMRNERDAIEKTNSDLIQGLSDALSKERELYNNSQNDKELTTLQRQLAILQRSGGSAAEISNLQQQIDSKQQDIYFDRQQQEIDALQEASDAQLERLDRQIELEEETLEYQKTHGLLWDQVYQVMNKSEQYIEAFITGNNSEYWSKSQASFEQEMRQIVFETQQWKAFAKDGGITSLLASIEAEVTKDSEKKTESKKKKKKKKTTKETQATEEGTQTQSEQPEGGKKQPEPQQEQPEPQQKHEPVQKENIIYEDCNDKYHYKITVGEDGKETTEKESHTQGTKTIGDAAHKVCILCGHDFGKVASGTKATDPEVSGGKLQPVVQMPPVIQQITDGLSQGLATVLSWLGVGQPSNTSGSAVPNASNDSIKETFKQLKEDMLQQYDLAVSYPDSLRDLQHIAQSTSSTINTNSNSPVIIEHAEVNMKVDKMNDKYDASRAADDVMKEMLTIARKTSAQNRIRR